MTARASHSAGGARTAPGPRAAALAIVLALALAAALAPASVARADDLAPYRALAGSPDAAGVVAIARSALERHFDPSRPAGADTAATDWPATPCGVYVSLVRGSRTRACVGSLEAAAGTLGEAVRRLAVDAAAADPRRSPLRRDELEEVRIIVSFAGPAEPIRDPYQVRPAREGLLVTGAQGSVAFLPGEARTVSWALGEARRAGVLVRMADAGFHRFDVVSIREEPTPSKEDSRETQ